MNIYSIFKKNKIEIDWQLFFQYSILDKLGKTIFESNSRNPDKKIILNPGLYHLEINFDKSTFHQKIII